MRRLKARALLGCSTVALATWCPAPALAQDEQHRSATVEEVIVTAARREQGLQDTALAVNAIGSDRLEAATLTDTSSLQTTVPSLQIASGGGSSFVYLRGVGANVYGAFTDNSVATYVDGVYVPRPTGAIQEFMDVERVEVLRGPQATLYGRNATGGAILINSASPTDVLTGSTDVRIGNEGTRRYRAMISGPLAGERLSGRLSVVHAEHDGYSTNLSDGSDYDSQDFWGARSALSFRSTDNLEFTLIGNYSRERGSPGMQKADELSLPFLPPPAGRGRPHSDDPRASYKNLRDSNPMTQAGGQLNIRWHLRFADLVSISSYQRYEIGPTSIDLDDSDAPLLEYRDETGKTSFLYEDLYLTSAPGRLEWQLGMTYAGEHTTLHLPTQTPAGLNTSDGNTNVDAYAFYGQLGYSLTDQLKLVGAARYSDETRSGVSTRTPPVGPVSRQTNEASWDDVSPKVSLEYRPTGETLVYLSATRGFKSGVFDPQNVRITADPETLWSYEAGLRTNMLDSRLIFNATAFHYDYKNLQVFSGVIQGSVVQTFLQNAGHAAVNGLEIEPAYEVTQDFRVGGSVALLDGHYLHGTVLADLANAIPAPPGGTATVPSSDVGGNRMIQAPELTASLFAEWRIDLHGMGALRLYADYFYQSERFYTAFEDPTLKSSSYDTVNARVTYTPPDDRFHIAAYVRNADDESVVSKMSRVPPFGTLVSYGAPRLYGLEIGFHF